MIDQALMHPTEPDDGSSEAIIKRLSAQMSAAAVDYSRFDAYYEGEHGLRFQSKEHKAAFAKQFGKYAENFCGLVVDAVEERLDVEGFRFPRAVEGDAADGGEGAASSPDPDAADPDAWRIWQDNQLDANSQIAHTEALVKGVVYVLVSPFASDRVAGRSPRITVEDPFEAIVERDPGSRERTVGMKRWTVAGDKRTYVTLYFPDRIEKWETEARSWRNQYGSGVVVDSEHWVHRQVPGEEWPLPHDLGVVPLIPLVNRPRLNGSGRSEIADIIPIQDAINKLAMDELVTSDTASFPQKWATGVDIPVDPNTGKSVESWQTAVDRFMSTPVPDAKFGQFPAAELKGYIEAIGQKVQAIASISRTPYHYFLQHGGQPPSGESLKSSETGLVRKALRKQRHFGEGWEEVIRLAFAALADPRGEVLDAEAQWADPESQTEAQHIDALTKKRSGLKVPLKQLWADAGYTPGQIASFERMLQAEAAMLKDTLVAPIDPAGAPESETIQETVGA
jgi:hypothetical protein